MVEMTSFDFVGDLQIDDLEEMEQKLEDILRRKTPIVTSEQIGMLAAKRKPLDRLSGIQDIEQQIKTVCHCHHLQGHVIGGICYYKQCRHAIHVHPREQC